MWVATAIIGSALVGGVVANKASSRAADAAKDANKLAADSSAAQLEFAKQQYADLKPTITALSQQAVEGAKLDNQLAQDSLERSATAWQQNQEATQPAVGQMGLNALGAQYLSPEQVQEIIGLQNVLSGTSNLTQAEKDRIEALQKIQNSYFGKYTFTPAMKAELDSLLARSGTASPAERDAATARLAELQRTAESNFIAKEGTEADRLRSTAAAQGAAVQGAYDKNAASTRQIGADYASGLTSNASRFGNELIGLSEADAKAILANSDTIQGDLRGMAGARRGEIEGFYQGQGKEVREVARQRARDNEVRANNQANADIANAQAQAQRELLRVGGDPNRMAALASEIAQGNQLARIGSGNQVAATNIANLNAADDQGRELERTGFDRGTAEQYGLENAALSVKSSALDAARAARTQAQQTALGMRTDAADRGLTATTTANQTAADRTLTGTREAQGLTFAGENAANTILNNADDKAKATLNSLQQGAANYGAGFANTSGQTTQNAIAAANGATTGLSSAVNAATNATQPVNTAYNTAQTAARTIGDSADTFLKSGILNAGSIVDTGSIIGGYLKSSKKSKKDRKKVDAQEILDGLEAAAPQSYDYKAGEGPPGRKVGAMAEDLQREFGDAVAPGGKVVDVQNMIGLEHAAIVGLAKRVKQLEQRKGR